MSKGKKLKRRLEDLERKAASTSASPEPSPADAEASDESRRQSGQSSLYTPQTSHGHSPEPQFDPQYHSESGMLSHQYYRQPSTTSSSQLSYPHYAYSEHMRYSPHVQQHSGYQSSQSSQSEVPVYSNFFQPSTSSNPTLPSTESTSVKQEHYDEGIDSFPASYAPWSGMEYTSHHPNQQGQRPPRSQQPHDQKYQQPPQQPQQPQPSWHGYSSNVIHSSRGYPR